MTDGELAARCQRGDRDARRLLYERCADRIYRLLLRMTRNEQDALDLAQDTFVRAFERIGTYDGAASLPTWLYRIAVNEALQFLRHRQVVARSLPRLQPAGISSGTDQHLEDRLDVAEAVARLPEDDQALVVLRYYEGLSYDEMAKALGKPAGTIASGLNRARRSLQALLEGPP